MEALATPLLCDAEQSLLVIADLQVRLAEAMPEAEFERLLKTCIVLLEAAKTFGIPILATEQQGVALGSICPQLLAHMPPEKRLLAKTGLACTSAEGFDAWLKESGRAQIILAGLEAHVCVLQTAFALRSLGRQVFVVEDAVLSRSPEHKVYALERMRQAGVVVLSGESVIFEWLRDAKHPYFHKLVGLL
jgi:nicotinamidase-related amidase